MSQPAHVPPTEARLAALIDRWHELVGQFPVCVKPSGALLKFESFLETEMMSAVGLVKEIKRARDNALRVQAASDEEYRALCRDRAKVQADFRGLQTDLKGLQNSMTELSGSCSNAFDELSTRDLDVAMLRDSAVASRSRLDDAVNRLGVIGDTFSQPEKGLDAISGRLSSLEGNLRNVQSADDIRALLREANSGDPPRAVRDVMAKLEKLCSKDGMEKQATQMAGILDSLEAIKGRFADIAETSEKQGADVHAAIERQAGTLGALGQQASGIQEAVNEQVGAMQKLGCKLVEQANCSQDAIKKLDDRLLQHIQAALTSEPAQQATSRHSSDGIEHLDRCSQVAAELMSAMAGLKEMSISRSRVAPDAGDADVGQAVAPDARQQAQDISREVKGIHEEIKTMSLLLNSVCQAAEEDPPRKRSKFKQASPRKARVGLRSPARPKSSGRRAHAGGAVLGEKESMPRTPPSASANANQEHALSLRNRLEPAISFLRSASPCVEPHFWWPDTIISDIWAVLGAKPFAAYYLEHVMLKGGGAEVGEWYCAKLVSEQAVLVAKALDGGGRCVSPWCKERGNCLQVSLAEAASATVQLRCVRFNRGEGSNSVTAAIS